MLIDDAGTLDPTASAPAVGASTISFQPMRSSKFTSCIAQCERLALREHGALEDDLEPSRREAASAGWEGNPVLALLERERASRRRSSERPSRTVQRARRAYASWPSARTSAAGLEGRDLGKVEDVEDVDPVAGGLDPAELVDREVAERMRDAAQREGEAGERHSCQGEGASRDQLPAHHRCIEQREVGVRRESPLGKAP